MSETPEGQVGEIDNSHTRMFILQPEMKVALARYVHAQARYYLWHGLKDIYGTKTEGIDGVFMEPPQWLSDATESDICEDGSSEWFLENAIQAEIERRVATALEKAEREADAEQGPLLDQSIRSVTNTLRRHTRKVRAIDRSGTRKALQGAGLLKTEKK